MKRRTVADVMTAKVVTVAAGDIAAEVREDILDRGLWVDTSADHIADVLARTVPGIVRVRHLR
ncbi:hypothetical protein [Nonomuraea sp. NPDC049028]|uniref:hypothetical protein n=1 Tax=Nonomuraea sp. NPDC049028 TaxID=3364348 RepID=UPI003717C4F9